VLRELLLPVAVAAMMLVSPRSWADGRAGTLDLVWSAPAVCPDGQSVEREVEALLGLATVSRERLSATAIVTPIASAWRVVLTTDVHGVPGRRTVEAPSCEALAHATALVLAITIDPHAAAQPPAGGVVAHDAGALALAEDAAPPTVALVPQARVESDSTEPPPRSSKLSLGGGAAAAVGALPGVAFAPEIALGWSSAAWRVDLTISYFPAVSARVDATRGGDLGLLSSALRGCRLWVAGGGPLELGPCAAFEGGAMFAQGVGVRHPGKETVPWFAVRAGALGALRLGRSAVWLVLSVDGEVPITRYRFEVDAVGIVHHPSPVGGRGAFGAEVRL